MEVNEEPRDSTDPVGNASPAPDPKTETRENLPAEGNAPPSPDGASCPTIMFPEDRPDSDGGSRKDHLHCEQVGEAGAEEESVPVGDIVDPQEMDTTPAATPLSPAASPETEEKIPIAEYHAPTAEGYVTPTSVLSATGSPTRPRASPKQKQLSSVEGSEIAAGLACAVKQHCGSSSELVPSSRLPGRMPYGLPSCLEGEEPERVGGRESQSSTSERDESLRTPPTTPVHAACSLDVSREEEPEDPIFATPPEENKSFGTNSPAADKKKDPNGNLLGPLDELAASPNHSTTVGSPAGAILSSPAGRETSKETVPPSMRSEGEPLTGSEPAAVSTRPSSPAAEGEDNPTIPPFQFTQPLNVSTDSRGNDFKSPSGEITEPYQRYLGQTSMRRSDWTYYQEQDQADPAEYHPSWPTGMKELGPIMIPAGSESQRRIPPLSPAYVGRILWRTIAEKQQKSWGNMQEQTGILHHMRTTDAAIKNDLDWKKTLRRYREDPTEGYLQTMLLTGEVLPFSEVVAIAYEYPCTLGKQQEGLHKRVVFSSTTGLPLITPALSGRLRLQDRRRSATESYS